MTTGKTIALTTWTSVSKVMSLLFSMPSRFAIALLLEAYTMACLREPSLAPSA